MDRRVIKTRRAIENAYVALRRAAAPETITVAAVADLADIGRGTFYLHYKDLSALEASIVDQVVDALVKQFEPASIQAIGGSYQNWLTTCISYLQSQRPILDLVKDSANESAVTRRIKQTLVASLNSAWDLNPLDADTTLALSYAVSGMIGLVGDWLQGSLSADQASVVAALDQHLVALATTVKGA
ncbi:TetR/AcrR family transcriptional regulator [Lacticaseibacillus parakribbianus]|uniref:TetR/AcrR family transcriptional regulator n=1 Tax=Lacticaseibacillus parakribbianus TaxID=2970927 RepID=UPI0021CB1473|nr:TetR/AcrR family transcriptional regulator [Lacticaseibacillus parakribbianus]